MERIQTAIAKARAARNALGETVSHADVPVMAPTSVAAPAVDIAAAWMSLAEAPLNPRRLDSARIVAHRPGPEAAPFDLMRTNLMRHLREHDWTRVAITSPSGGCGKTTTSLNLAFSLARQADLRVLVLELDLRRPAMVRTLGLAGKWRFSGVLDGSETVEAQLLRWGTNLAFGVNSSPTASPAELLSSARAAEAIDAIEARFRPDVILFDMPPMLVSDDTIAFLDQVDCALMVAAAEQSTVGQIDRTGKELAEHTKVLGVVLNKCRFLDREEGYGYDGDY
jgi:protein-tyrosine kinase